MKLINYLTVEAYEAFTKKEQSDNWLHPNDLVDPGQKLPYGNQRARAFWNKVERHYVLSNAPDWDSSVDEDGNNYGYVAIGLFQDFIDGTPVPGDSYPLWYAPKMGLRREILEEIKKILQLENNLKTTFSGVKRMLYGIWENGENEYGDDMSCHMPIDAQSAYKALIEKYKNSPRVEVELEDKETHVSEFRANIKRINPRGGERC